MRELFTKLKSILPERLTNFQIFIIQLVIAFILYHPYITNEYYADDYFFISILKSKEFKYPIAGFWSIDIKDYETFQNLWWKDENVKAKFFRPLPSIFFSLIYWIDETHSALILHLFSILLHTLVSLSVFLVLYKFSKMYSPSFLASLIFLISEDHSMTVGWISTNTDLFAVLFINLGLYYHVKHRETSLKLHRRLSKFFIFISLLCKETAVIGPIAIILYEFILLESQRKEKNIFKRFFNKLILLIKNEKYWRYHFLLLIFFLAFYKLSGFGINNLMYIDPFKRPYDYIKNVVTGLPTMLVGLLTNVPFGFVIFNQNLTYSFMALGIFLYIIFSISLVPYWKTRMIHYSFLLFTISLLPQLITVPSERLIYFPFVFGSFLIAYLILNINILKKHFFPNNPKGIKFIGNIFGYYLILSTIVMAFYLSLKFPDQFKDEFNRITSTVNQANALIDDETKNIYYLTTPSIVYTFYLNDITKVTKDFKISVYPLSSFNGDMKIKKLNEKSFLLVTNSRGWLNNIFAKVARVYPKLEVGKNYKLPVFTGTILKTTLDSKDLLSAKFEFNNFLSDSKNLFVYHNGNKMVKLNPDTLAYNTWYLLRDKLESLY
ncbi:MAG: hypothetical protein NUV92_01310 [Ignavibacteria bacterium]|nr:hypothetical protein [Ignavibacteria bacterium]MDH7527747.1 hypothetical protein [Ignavibacteria bacterium]